MLDFIWILVFLFALFIESCTVQLVSIWFCVGAVFAEIALICNLSITTQVVIFIITSVLCLLIFYPLVLKNLKKKKTNLNADSIIKKDGVVVEEINNLKSTGQIKVGGVVWTARSSDDSIVIPTDTIVTVVKIDGVKAIVNLKKKEV